MSAATDLSMRLRHRVLNALVKSSLIIILISLRFVAWRRIAWTAASAPPWVLTSH